MVAYLTSKSAEGHEQETYELRLLTVTTGADRVWRDIGLRHLVRCRGWLQNDAGLVLVESSTFDDIQQTRGFELVVSRLDGSSRPDGTLDHVANVYRFFPRHSDLYFARTLAGVTNLFAYSFATRSSRQISENSLIDVAFGGAAPLGSDHVVGIRHERTRDIYVIDARRRPDPGSTGR
jgi:hypothetical protein